MEEEQSFFFLQDTVNKGHLNLFSGALNTLSLFHWHPGQKVNIETIGTIWFLFLKKKKKERKKENATRALKD